MNVSYTLISSAFLMGLVGGPHCIAMCGAACAGLNPSAHLRTTLLFHTGRLTGYAGLGALAAMAMQSLAWASGLAAALHPLWTFFHVLVFFWGLVLLVLARQPVWVDAAGKNIWAKIKNRGQTPQQLYFVGVLWALMPCGLLYSAMVIAAFNGTALGGTLAMAAFAVGSGASLFVASLAWLKLKSKFFKNKALESIGMRMAGVLLSVASGWAIWMDLTHQTKIWCVT